MHPPVRWIAAALLAATATLAAADTIYLKNGTSLSVDRARENGDKVEYTMGGSRYTLPKSSVLRIEAGAPGISIGPVVSTSAVPPPRDSGVAVAGPLSSSLPGVPRVPITVPAEPPEVAAMRASLRQEITTLGRVDPVALARIESQGNASRTAFAYVEAGRMEGERNEWEKARSYFQQALKFAPGSAGALEWYAMSLLTLGRPADAAIQAERATRAAPDSPDAYRLLGIAYYSADKSVEAVRAWEHAVKLRPDADLQRLLSKAQRESSTEENFNQQETWHFSLRYDGQHTAWAVQRELLNKLEAQYRELARDLDYAPRENIVVVLYTNRAFFDITQAPSWAGAVNDGKLRIPVEGVQSMTPELERVLKHELVHSFIRHMDGGRCPAWLNEGLAQMLEPRSLAAYARLLAAVYQQHRQIPVKALEAPFTRFSATQAAVAYTESLMATEYLRGSIGMPGLRKLLQRIASGDSPEAALRAVNRTNYAQLEDELVGYVAKIYGQ
jgi:tetratricopeptide (TPR) repeat protein